MADFNIRPPIGMAVAMIARAYSSIRVEDCPDTTKESEEYKKGYDAFMKEKKLSEYAYGQLNARKDLGMSGTRSAEVAMDNMFFGIDPIQSALNREFGGCL